MAVTCTRNVQVIVRCGVITVYYLSVLCSGSDKAPPPLRLETIGINCGGDMGVRRCLARSLTRLAFRCALQRVQTVPAAIHSGRIPPHDYFQPGTEDSAIPLTTPDMVRSGRVLQPQLNLHLERGITVLHRLLSIGNM